MCEVCVVIIMFFIWCRISLLTTHSDFLFIVDLARKTELQVVNKNNSYLQGEPARYTELGTETNLETLTLFVRPPTAKHNYHNPHFTHARNGHMKDSIPN